MAKSLELMCTKSDVKLCVIKAKLEQARRWVHSSLCCGRGMTAIQHVNDVLRLVAHAFHPPESIVVLEVLLRENRCVKDEELAAILHLHQKQVRKCLSDLKTGDLVKSESKTKDERDKGEKAIAHLFWYVDYKHAIDCVKYRIHQISRKYEDEKSYSAQIQMYRCNDCKQEYTALQASELALNGWRCESCPGEIEEISNEDSAANTHNLKKAFHSQIAAIMRSLKLVEANPLPIFPRRTAPSFMDAQMISTPGSTASHSYSSSSRSLASAAFVGSTNVDIVVEMVGVNKTNTAPGAPIADTKVTPPWLSTSTDSSKTTTSSSTLKTEDEIDEETQKAYIKQYMEQLQRQGIVNNTQPTKKTTNIKQEVPEEDAPVAKRQRVEEAPTIAPITEEVAQITEEPAAEQPAEVNMEDWEDPIVTVEGEEMQFLSVLGNDDLINKMSPEEYDQYADVYYKYASFRGESM